MCVASNQTMPQAPAVAPAPTREAATASVDPTTLANQSKAVIQRRQGIFGNLRTSPLGDASYGMFAQFGKRAA